MRILGQKRMRYTVKSVLLILSFILLFHKASAEVENWCYPIHWTGVYYGAHAGYGKSFIHTKLSSTNFQSISQRNDYNGVLGGIHLGYNTWIECPWMFSLEGNLTWTNVSADGVSSLSPQSGLFKPSQRMNAFGTLRARIGYLYNDRLLFFVTGGAAWANVRYQTEVITPNQFVFDHFIRNKGGGTAGIGCEYALWKNLKLSLDYFYLYFGDTKSIVESNIGIIAKTTFQTRLNVFRVAFNCKFN